MMNQQELRKELHIYIKQHEAGISPDEIELFLENNKPMRSDSSPDFSKTNIRRHLLDMCLNVFGREPESNVMDASVTNLYRKFQDFLSVKDIAHVFDQMILGNIEAPNKYFKPTDIIYIVNGFQGRKKVIQRCFHRVSRAMNDSKEGKERAARFLSEARIKLNRGEEITIYERSAIGKSVAQEYDSKKVSVIRENARLNWKDKQKEVAKDRNVFFEQMFKDDENETGNLSNLAQYGMKVPIVMTEDLYFGILMFQEYQNSIDHRKTN